MPSIDDAQREMRQAYACGAPGMAASATAWLVAGVVAWQVSASAAVWALLIGGMAIHPAGMLICRLMGRSGQHDKTNPLGPLALEGTVWLIFCLPIAYGVSLHRVGWFFPAMLLVIGGRYFTFRTLYGLRIYLACGAALGLAGYGLAAAGMPPAVVALSGAAIEAAFAVAILRLALRAD